MQPMEPGFGSTAGAGNYTPGIGTRLRTGGPTIGVHDREDDFDEFLKTKPGTPPKAGAKTSRKSNPSLSLVQKKAQSDVKFWRHRNERMREHQEMVQQSMPQVGEGEDAIVLNDNLGIIQKISGMLAKQTPMKEVRPRRPDLGDSAEALSFALDLMDEKQEDASAEALRNPIQYEEIQTELLRGWLATRVSFDSEMANSFAGDPYDYYPYKDEIYDPATVYPNAATTKYTRVTHEYAVTLGELRDNTEFDPKALRGFDSVDDDKSITVTGVYEFNDRWDYHAVYSKDLRDGVWLKKPTPMGYMPWVITLAGGMFYRWTPWQKDESTWTRDMGVGILHTIALNSKYLNRYYSMAATMIGDSANAFTAIYSKNPEDDAPAGGFKRGSSQRFDPDARLEQLTKEKDLRAILPFIQALEDRKDRYSLPKIAYATGDSTISSGYMASLYQYAATDIVFPYIRSWELHRRMVYRKKLEIFRDFAPLDKPLMVVAPPDPQNQTYRWMEFWPEDIAEQGTTVYVTLDPLTIQDKINLGQLSVMLVDKNIISRETARGMEFLRIKNPKLEDARIISEMAKMDPEVIKQMIPIMLGRTGQQLLSSVWLMAQQEEQQKQNMNAAQPVGGPPGGGPPPGGPGGATPPRPPMLNGAVAPPAAQGMMPHPPMPGPRPPAVGGVGGGGMPPPSPGTNQRLMR